MNILVTGASGFIGSHIVDRLIKNHNVFALARPTSKLDWVNPKSQLIYGDLFNLENLKVIKNQIDIVIHSAGIVQAKNKKEFYKINSKGTENLARFFVGTGLKKFIFISSLTAKGPSQSITPNSISSDKPITDYGKSKLEAEKLLKNTGLNNLILRPGAVFGERDKAMYSVFKMASKGIFVNVGKNEKFVSMIDCKNLVDIIDKSINIDKLNETIDCAFETPVSLRDFNEILKRTYKKSGINLNIPEKLIHFIGFVNEYISKIIGITSVFDRDKAKDISQQYWIADTKKLKDLVNWQEIRRFEDAVVETKDWYQENKWI